MLVETSVRLSRTAYLIIYKECEYPKNALIFSGHNEDSWQHCTGKVRL